MNPRAARATSSGTIAPAPSAGADPLRRDDEGSRRFDDGGDRALNAEDRAAGAKGPPGQLVARLRHEGGLRGSRRRRSGVAVLLVTIVVGGGLTAGLTWTSWTLDRHSEHRLLKIQTDQAGVVISSTVATLTDPLRSALQIAAVTGGQPGAFDRFISRDVGTKAAFASASLWQGSGTAAHALTTVGASAAATRPTIEDLVTRAEKSSTFLVASAAGTDGQQTISYAIADPAAPGFAIYAERLIPRNRQVAVESNTAFSELDYATYLGSAKDPANLATTDVPQSRLPLTGNTEQVSVPFGDSSIVLVASPRVHLGSQLGADLPWVLLGGGLALTAATTWAAWRLLARNRAAEKDAETIGHLYERLDGLYGQQRGIAETLQQALLPKMNPMIPGLEIATRYVAGAQGVDVGGDWYSIVRLDDERFAFVVGDVSGRGVSAATVMAQLRYTMRAYLVEGHSPDVALTMCARQLDFAVDGHFATVLAGVADTSTRTISVASAGHFNPLLLDADGGASYTSADAGPPLGVADEPYTAHAFAMTPGSALIGFTDGLVERRGESIDAGLDRLARTVTRPDSVEPLDVLVGRVVSELGGDTAEDDIAVLAFRWIGSPGGDTP